MEVPKLYRISAEVEREQKARFRVFSKSHGRTMRAQLTYMVTEAIAKVDLPEETAVPMPPAARTHAPVVQRQTRPIVMTVAQAREFQSDPDRFKDSDKWYAARICVGDTNTEALAFMRREYDPVAPIDFDPPVTQAAWAAVREAVKNGGTYEDEESPFRLDPDSVYLEHRANGLSHAQAVERVEWSCSCNGVTGWVPPQNEESI